MKFWPDIWQDYCPTTNSEMRTILKWKKNKYSVAFRRKNNINHQLPKTKKECKFTWNFMSGWSEGFEGNGSDIGPRWDGVRSGLKMVTDSLPLFLSRRNNSICTYTGLLIALTNKMIQKQYSKPWLKRSTASTFSSWNPGALHVSFLFCALLANQNVSIFRKSPRWLELTW